MAIQERAMADPARADELDAADPLASFLDRFEYPDPDFVYLDANSLGRLPKQTAARLERVIHEEWGDELVRGWDHWIDMPHEVGDRLGVGLLGAKSGEVLISDSTTVNFYKLATAALALRPDRTVVVTDRSNFPTDRYVLEGLALAHGLEIRWLSPDPVEGIQPADVAAALDDRVALVTFSHVNYRSSAIADMAAITALAHDAGALMLWDLSHAVGSVPLDLEGDGVDLAVGCTYKYLNGGPGAPAFLYIRRSLQPLMRNPIQGWMGQRDQFAMGQGYDPQPDMRAWLTGTPTILALAAVDEGVALVVEAGMDRIRAKSIALTEYAIELHDALLAPLGFRIGSPREASRRGAHVALRRADAEKLCSELMAAGIGTDFRAPDSIRLGVSPLTTRYRDAWTAVNQLAELATDSSIT
jgi:kynureninase